MKVETTQFLSQEGFAFWALVPSMSIKHFRDYMVPSSLTWSKEGVKVWNNLYATFCLKSRPVVHTWADRNLWVARSLRGWMAFRLAKLQRFVFSGTQDHAPWGRKRGRERKQSRTLFIKNTIRPLCKWAAVKTTLPIITLIISFLCEFAYFISLLFIMGDYASILMWLKKHIKQIQKEMKDGREGEGRAGRLILSIFQLILLKASQQRS